MKTNELEINDLHTMKTEEEMEFYPGYVLQKVNIPFEEQIYKNLVDLKVSDNDLHYGQDKRIKSKHFERIKDKEPELSEFYEPSFNEEYVLKIEKLQIDPLKVISYDGFSISDRMKNWQIS
ncbi:uncharacterized protein LOC142330255 [Lycorma delicatula]|uniref:uncharacterized protein LOC142330255 n=1 Tax=Lycorma delicatula TaxID=130591 RepID=UPI003F50E9D4